MFTTPSLRTLLLCLLAWCGQACMAQGAGSSVLSFNGRDIIVHLPPQMPAPGARALVIVLHGGGGSAQRIAGRQSESGMNLDAQSDKNGFVVAYLNGSSAMRIMADRSFAWNAGGGCCGQPAKNNIDDVGYISAAVNMLVQKYGINRERVFGMGHSNGAMMTQRLVCDVGLYTAAVAISGPLNYQTASCPGARGKRMLAIHGANDDNVPLAGGMGTKGPARGPYQSQEYARRVFTASGAAYTLDVIPGAAHSVDGIDEALQKTQGMSLAEKITRFFGLAS